MCGTDERLNNIQASKKGTKLFSNEHDPRLKYTRAQKNRRNIKYVFEENLYKTRNSYFDNPSHFTLREYEIGNELLKNKNQMNYVAFRLMVIMSVFAYQIITIKAMW